MVISKKSSTFAADFKNNTIINNKIYDIMKKIIKLTIKTSANLEYEYYADDPINARRLLQLITDMWAKKGIKITECKLKQYKVHTKEDFILYIFRKVRHAESCYR